MAPIVDGAEARFGAEVQFVRLNANDRANRRFLDAARLTGHPTVFVFDADGLLRETLLGRIAAERLSTAIEAALARQPVRTQRGTGAPLLAPVLHE